LALAQVAPGGGRTACVDRAGEAGHPQKSVHTGCLVHAKGADDKLGIPDAYRDQVDKDIAASIPLGRFGTPE
jgi:hypothetical protein